MVFTSCVQHGCQRTQTGDGANSELGIIQERVEQGVDHSEGLGNPGVHRSGGGGW